MKKHDHKFTNSYSPSGSERLDSRDTSPELPTSTHHPIRSHLGTPSDLIGAGRLPITAQPSLSQISQIAAMKSAPLPFQNLPALLLAQQKAAASGRPDHTVALPSANGFQRLTVDPANVANAPQGNQTAAFQLYWNSLMYRKAVSDSLKNHQTPANQQLNLPRLPTGAAPDLIRAAMESASSNPNLALALQQQALRNGPNLQFLS